MCFLYLQVEAREVGELNLFFVLSCWFWSWPAKGGKSLLSECFQKYLAEMGDTLFSYKMPPANEGVVVCACGERM